MADFLEGPIVGEWKISADSIFLDAPLIKYQSAGVISPSSIVMPSTSTGIALYNTSDQVTNFERVRMQRASNIFGITLEKGGGGINRVLRLDSGGTLFTMQSATHPFWTFSGVSSNTGGGSGFVNLAYTSTASSGTPHMIYLNPTINQTSTAGYNALTINTIESTTGSGAKNLILAQVGGVTKFGVDNFGHTTFDATMTAGGTTGNQTINKPSGSVNIAAGSAAITVTNSLVSTTSLIHAYIRTADATLTFIKSVVAGAGSFVITCNANATAETSIGFIVYN